MSDATIRMGPWTVYPSLNLLERGSRTIRVEPRAMDVLVVLARHGGQVVSVEQLIESVWKGVVVGDGSVYLAISQLRQAFDDSEDDTQYIETIPKRGYRLTVPVEQAELAASAVHPTIDPSVAANRAQPVAADRARPVSNRAPGMHRASASRLLLSRWWLAPALIGAVALALFAVRLYRSSPPLTATSVAVLPFENLSSDPEQDYFADGVTEEILNTLARTRGLRVTGRASSFHFRNRRDDLRTIGKALGVEHILEGSVRKAGDQVRITARLSNAWTGDRLWSETYQRRLDDIFVLQDEISTSVAQALQVKLGVGDVGAVPGMTRNVAAYDAYLRGMALNLQFRPESFPPAIAHLQRAVALDPSFSVAWAGLSTVYVNGAFAVPGRAGEWRQKSRDALEHARLLTPDAPHVLLERGIAESRRQNWLEAAALYAQLQASYARYGMDQQAWGPRGVFLLSVGRVREAIDPLERARAVEPLAPAFAGFLSDAYLARGDLESALAEVERGLALEGLESALSRMGLAIALSNRERAEIEKWVGSMPEDEPGAHLHRRLARFIDAPTGAPAEIRSLAATATSAADKALLAQWAAYYQEPELALELLADATPHLFLPSMLWEPLMKDVRGLPAFKQVVRQLGLVDYWRRYGWSDFCQPLSESDFVCR